MKCHLYLGIDIGTTNIAFCVADLKDNRQVECYSIPNNGNIKDNLSFSRIQDARVIAETVLENVTKLCEKHPSLCGIGLSGQMHGILYIDKNGSPVSPLFTWQDERANQIYCDNITYADYITEETEKSAKYGYGLATHFYNIKNGLVPKNAVSLCSASDFAAMKLCGLCEPVVHTSMAQSFGLFDNRNLCFDISSCQKIGIDKDFLPKTTCENKTMGFYKNIPVCVAIGDNQASFLGAVRDTENDILVNYGTGSQISIVSNYRDDLENAELRPFIGGKYLVCGAALCGGRAYALLENFFRQYTTFSGVDADSQYEVMGRLALEELEKNEENLPVFDTRFCGTRNDSKKTASITNLTIENFTPSKLTLSLLYGMATELYNMYLDAKSPPFSKLVASGNGVRKNKALQVVISKVFGKELILPEIQEEAALGACRFAQLCVERI